MQRPCHAFSLKGGHFLKNFHFPQNGPGLIHQQHSLLGKQDFAAGALQQHHTQFILELADLSAQCRLADMTGICRAAKVIMLRKCHQIFQIPDIHACVSVCD